MSLIVEQMAVKRLPSELVNNAAFVKMVDFDPVHESDAPAGPAEQLKVPDMDTLTLSKDLLENAIPLTPAPADGQTKAPLDITTPEALAHMEKSQKLYTLMKSWNALINECKQKAASYDYAGTISLFKGQCAAWEQNLQASDPEGYQLWTGLFKLEARA